MCTFLIMFANLARSPADIFRVFSFLKIRPAMMHDFDLLFNKHQAGYDNLHLNSIPLTSGRLRRLSPDRCQSISLWDYAFIAMGYALPFNMSKKLAPILLATIFKNRAALYESHQMLPSSMS